MNAGRYDTVVIGGGHNGLAAAAYLARAGMKICILEQNGQMGGAAVSASPFSGIGARPSRYSYLVSLLPDQLVRDLDLDISLRSRPVASYTPYQNGGLLIDRPEGPATAASFAELTGSDQEYAAWQRFYAGLEDVARVLAPTMLEPLPGRTEIDRRMRSAGCGELWRRLAGEPLGDMIEDTFRDDLVRGVVLTDALIGIDTWAHDPSLRQNRCFLYHMIGNGTGEWRVPVGGMGAVTGALVAAATRAGATVVTNAEATAVTADGREAEITFTRDGEERTIATRNVLSGVAPWSFDRLWQEGTGESLLGGAKPEGSQLKINMVVSRLPRLASGHDPERAFAGTFHIDECYGELAEAHAQVSAGELPDRPPGEIYCHSLTDPSIVEEGLHTLTLFGLHAPARLFKRGQAAARDELAARCLAGLNRWLAEPIEDCLARDAAGNPCVEAVSPLDLEDSLGMPGGHIFHGDLSWPFAEDEAAAGTWGVETKVANVFVCGAGAVRGGGVSGIGGHNAAHAILSRH